VFSTWLGMFVVLGVMLFIFTVVTIGIGALNYQVVMWRLFQASLAVWFEIGVVMAFAVMLSCSFGPITSAIGALAFIFIGHAFVSLLGLPELTQAPWYIPNLEVFNVINPVAHGGGYSLVYGTGMTLSFVAWVVLLMLGAAALFSRRDL